jgi:hypothetical protein
MKKDTQEQSDIVRFWVNYKAVNTNVKKAAEMLSVRYYLNYVLYYKHAWSHSEITKALMTERQHHSNSIFSIRAFFKSIEGKDKAALRYTQEVRTKFPFTSGVSIAEDYRKTIKKVTLTLILDDKAKLLYLREKRNEYSLESVVTSLIEEAYVQVVELEKIKNEEWEKEKLSKKKQQRQS